MKRTSRFNRLALLLCLLLPLINAHAQKDDPPKIEIGGQFSSLGIRPPNLFEGLFESATNIPSQVEPGFGGRFTYNLNRHFALEAEGNFFPHRNTTDFGTGGRVLQGQFGVKAGQRFKKFGVFGKVRPGFVSFSETETEVGRQTFGTGAQQFTFPIFEPRRKTYLATDVGGVLEFYPSRRIVTRIDAGDTIIRYHNIQLPFFSPAPMPSLTASSTTHNFQLSAGVGFRFLGPASSDDDDKSDANSAEHAPKFELGAQFTSLTFRTTFFRENFIFNAVSPFKTTSTELGLGGRFSVNLNDHLALEAEVNFFPRKSSFRGASFRGDGRILQGQFGVKAGKRFQKFGIFGKARPGFVSYETMTDFLGFNPNFDPFGTTSRYLLRTGRKTYFSTDLGGVFEFYPSRRILTRFDAGDTLIHYGAQTLPSLLHPFTSETMRIPPELSHNLQFSAGVGFRF
jgi:hypothetical protein